ncbi:hypothetical protein LY78DRAFT_663506 [Colletotrichum sublineola]|nr:hypothetical protein LY78DRAFT_663506 [Colletotrichum sublineola]
MAALIANNRPRVDHMSTRDDKMAGEDGPTFVHGDNSKPTTAQKDMGISSQIENGSMTETDVTQTEPAKPDENKTVEAPDSLVNDEPISTDKSVPLPNETAEINAARGATDGSRTPPPEPTDYHPPGNLYRQYLDMVKRISAGETGESLLTGVIDYMKVVDERLSTIEGKLRINEEGPAEETPPPPSPDEDFDPEDIRNEVKFFEAVVDDFRSSGDLVDMAADQGRFSYTKDHPQVLRVLYNRLPDAMTIDKTNPKPGQIDITYISILSEPIACFFRDVLSLDCGEDHYCVRLSKPFRPLIKNIKPLKDHLAKLEKAYGHLQLNHTPNEANSGTEDPMKPVDNDFVGAGEPTEPISAPTPPHQDEISENHEKPFLRPIALAHFRTIIQFVDLYLQKSLESYAKLKAGEEDKVAFENMWMLFDAGTTIYCPYRSGKETFATTDFPGDMTVISGNTPLFDDVESRARYSPQAYCVLSTRGGTSLKTALMPGGIQEDVEENDFLLNVDALLRLDRLDLLRYGDQGGFRKEPMTRHAPGGAATRRNKNTTSKLVISCFNVEYDGDRFGTQIELFEIKPYNGLKDIRDLEVFPVQYLKSEEVSHMLQRGRKFLELTNNGHMSYEGTTAGSTRETINSEVIVDFKTAFERSSELPDISEIRPSFSTESHWPRTTDPGQGEAHDWYEHDKGCNNDHRRWCYAPGCQKATYYGHQDAQSQKVLRRLASFFDIHATQQAKSRNAREEFRLYFEENGLMSLFPGVVPGYALRNRKWVQLDLDRLQNVHHGDDWNNLVLPKGHREMVQAMVESYTRRSDGSHTMDDQLSDRVELDLVRGKGKGCIILLHGAPGVGKTSTAECVAAYTKRPLYPITCGDIGHLPDVVEANLERHFKLAHRWACVLLLDEADVFLAKRTKTDVKRNGLVSVFLRILEYYPGILFLTTNRVGAIDDAFRSRLHLTLYYPKLLEKQSIKIWKNNIGKLKEVNEQRVRRGQQPIKYDKNEIIKWASINWENLQWNGRQIRNAFQTAIALAEFKAQSRKSRKREDTEGSLPTPKKPKPPVLDQDTFTLIADASNQFNDYLLQTHGQDEETTASRDQVRPPSFKAKPTRIKRVEESSESESDSETSSGSSRSSNSSGPDSDVESDATVGSVSAESDSEADKKSKKGSIKKSKNKSEKFKKEKKSSDGAEKTKKKKKKRSEG